MEISKLLQVKPADRDEAWEKSFLEEFPKCVLTIDQDIPQTEYDGWPYLHVSTAEKGEPALKLIEWLSSRGIGLVVNSFKSEPDYVFSYGMLWSYRARGSFLGHLSPTSQAFDYNPQKYKHAGPPSESILPDYARKVIRQFLTDQGIIAPKVLALSEDQKGFDLCFSVEALGYPPEKEHQGVLEALSWFFPPDYSLVLAREPNLPPFHLL